jgi:hypothetical protein
VGKVLSVDELATLTAVGGQNLPKCAEEITQYIAALMSSTPGNFPGLEMYEEVMQ